MTPYNRTPRQTLTSPPVVRDTTPNHRPHCLTVASVVSVESPLHGIRMFEMDRAANRDPTSLRED
jgi:hypothetical protein